MRRQIVSKMYKINLRVTASHLVKFTGVKIYHGKFTTGKTFSYGVCTRTYCLHSFSGHLSLIRNKKQTVLINIRKYKRLTKSQRCVELQHHHSPQKGSPLNSTLFRVTKQNPYQTTEGSSTNSTAVLTFGLFSKARTVLSLFFPSKTGPPMRKCPGLFIRLVVGTARISS